MIGNIIIINLSYFKYLLFRLTNFKESVYAIEAFGDFY